jgi:isopentenyl-diphosphate delta-isomerase
MRRLQEEMGFSTSLHKEFDFIYKAEFGNGLTEHEFDHVFTGMYDGIVTPDKNEVSDYCYKSLDEIQASMSSHPRKYTAWFCISFAEVRSRYAEKHAGKVEAIRK